MKDKFVIDNKLARELIITLTLILGFMNLYWLHWVVGVVYLIVSIGLVIYGTKNKKVFIASRFWILVLPFLGIINGPSKIMWFLAFLLTSWIASKNAFVKNE